MTTTFPAGCRQNAAGHWVPEDKVQEHDRLRDDLVREIVAQAKAARQQVSEFKTKTMADTQAYLDLLAQKYSITPRGLKPNGKGNVTLASYDGSLKVEIANQESVIFGEELKIAKQLIDDCIHRWTADSSSTVKALIEHAFQTDKAGNLSYGRILGLTRLSIDDPQWQQAMKAIKDSLQVVGSKLYLRIYERPAPDQPYRQISIDLATV